MAATPKTGQLRFKGASGKVYTFSIYNSDVAAAFVTWNLNGTATTSNDNYFIAPETMTLQDVSVVTGIVDTTALLLYANGASQPGYLIQWANVVNTLTFRSFPPMTVKGGTRIQLQEIA